MPTKRPRIGERTEESALPRDGERDASAAPPRRTSANESLHSNRKRLGVDQQHRTETMRRRGRGTFP